LHRAYYDTADAYIPMLAGAALGDIFINSAYRKLTGQQALDNPEVITNLLDFEKEFKEIDSHNVFPLLARYDQIITYERQKLSYDGHCVQVIEKGHITAAADFAALRQHIHKHISPES